MALSWTKAPKNNGFVAKSAGGEYHVYRFEKGSRKHEATLNGDVVGLWSDAADAMADIDRTEAGIANAIPIVPISSSIN